MLKQCLVNQNNYRLFIVQGSNYIFLIDTPLSYFENWSKMTDKWPTFGFCAQSEFV